MPAPTQAAPISAPARVPRLHIPWKRAIIGAPARRSTVPAWVFIATSSAPWNIPHNASAANSAGPDRASPTVVPAAA
ncbi:hypothetical protein MOKP118_30780 [Mycobacterium avium subsp. hominissuis]